MLYQYVFKISKIDYDEILDDLQTNENITPQDGIIAEDRLYYYQIFNLRKEVGFNFIEVIKIGEYPIDDSKFLT